MCGREASTTKNADTKPHQLTRQWSSKYKLWQDILTPLDLKKGETVYGLRDAIELIYRHQHPADCSTAKFILVEAWEEGFGSEMHAMGAALSVGLNTNRIIIQPLKSGHNLYQTHTCK